MAHCLVCDSPLQTFMEFGKMPIANRFVNADEFADEFFFDLAVGLCPDCFMVQLVERVPSEMMFNASYAYFSSISTVMEQHFETMARHIGDLVADRESPFVVELGCNDGIMLRHLAARGVPHLGIEPSTNVAAVAEQHGIEVLSSFFNAQTAEKIRASKGQADVICGANVMCHIENINSAFEGIAVLLAQDGVLLFEDPYLLDIVRQTSFDQIYDEHVFYFSALSVARLAERHGMQLVDVEAQHVHGGSMRYYIKRGGTPSPSDRVVRQLSTERDYRLHEIDGYADFRARVDRVSFDLRRTLEDFKTGDLRVAGYGATSKSTTLYNYADIGPELIAYISDTTPTKIGKFTPGTHIPIRPHEFFRQDIPPYTLLSAWNHRREILAKEERYRAQGGKFITFFPELRIE